jgi:sugar lactone lactonase YvrE
MAAASVAVLCVGIAMIVMAVVWPHFLPPTDLLSLPYPYSHLSIAPFPDAYIDIIDNIKTPSSAAAVRNYMQIHEYIKRRSIKLNILHDGNIKKLFESEVQGAESIGFAATSSDAGITRLTMLDKYGVIKQAQLDPVSGSFTLLNSSINIGPGRPLGFHHMTANTIVVCDSLKGLLEVDLTERPSGMGDGGRITVLTNAVSPPLHSPGTRPLHPPDQSSLIRYANDLDVSADRRSVYFSSSTDQGVVAYDPANDYYDTMRSFLLTWLAGDVSGRLLCYNYDTKTTSVLMDGLFYANGVALAEDNSYVLVVETIGLRVMKYYLTGPFKGGSEIWIDNLPGFPDGITRSSDGASFLLSLVAPLSVLVPLSKGRVSRWLMAWALAGPLKQIFAPLIKKFGCVLRVSASTGEATEVFLDEEGATVSTISAAAEDGAGRVYFGNLGGNFVSYYDSDSQEDKFS